MSEYAWVVAAVIAGWVSARLVLRWVDARRKAQPPVKNA